MDPTTDPRLQHYPINVADFQYSSQPANNLQGVQYDQSLQNYALNLQRQAAVAQVPSINVSPQRASQRTGVQYSPQSAGRSQPRRQSHAAGSAASPLRNNQSPSKVKTTTLQQQQQQPSQNVVYANLPSNYANVNSTHQLQDQKPPVTAPSYFSVQGLQSRNDINPNTNPRSYFTTNAAQHHQPTTQTLVRNTSNDTHPPDTTNTITTTAAPASSGPINDSPNPFSSTFPLIPSPPDLTHWRTKLFNITHPLVLSETEYLTYFPHIDNVYSHRSTQKYKRKPFVSHYWDCRLKGRPSGTKKSDDPNKKKRKRTARERDLCDVKIKVTEYFSWEECRRLGLMGAVDGLDDGGGAGIGAAGGSGAVDSAGPSRMGRGDSDAAEGGREELTIVMEGGMPDASRSSATEGAGSNAFGMLEPAKNYPKGHPGAEGKRWFMVQRVNGNAGVGGGSGGGEEEDGDGGHVGQHPGDPQQSNRIDAGLDHKHTLEESDKIKKNSVQRWLAKEEKENKSGKKDKTNKSTAGHNSSSPIGSPSNQSSLPTTFYASGQAQKTARLHKPPASSQLTLYGNSYCPFTQRIWIALEVKQIPYQYVEILPANRANLTNSTQWPPEMAQLNPDGNVPSIKHGNWCVWDSSVMMEYLEDLAMGHNLLPLGNPQLRAHCRLWVDHINRKIIPAFYSLLLTPSTAPTHVNGNDAHSQDERARKEAAVTEKHSMLVTTLQTAITNLVNASHAVGPFFLGLEFSFVDIAFAPWIIRLSRVLSYYRSFPQPEVGTRWQSWVNAIEADERVRRTVSDEHSYHNVYGGVAEEGWDGIAANVPRKSFVEWEYAAKLVVQEGFGLGGDAWYFAKDRQDGTVPPVV